MSCNGSYGDISKERKIESPPENNNPDDYVIIFNVSIVVYL
jgi:hypothetical protein